MYKFLLAIAIAAGAGLIDIAPMVLRKAPADQIATAFLHWLVVGVFIAYIDVPFPAYVKGALVGLASTLPVAIQMSKTHPSSVLPVLLISVVLGAVVGVVGAMVLPR